jgi:hypothetical protein
VTPPAAKPEPDDAPPGDEDLIAYLDGEADPATAVRVEAEIAHDPTARAKAAALKKTFDLLDYLPKPQPSQAFTTKTLTKLDAVNGSRPSTAALPTRIPARFGPWVAAGLIAVALGFVAHRVARPYLTAPAEPDLADLPIIDRLPFYAGADDLAFVKRLNTPDLFGDYVESAEGPDHTAVTPTPDQRAKRIELFRSYPAARRQQLRTLHHDLTSLPRDEQERLVRVLEAYAGWLARLPEKLRMEVLDAPTADARLAAVRQVQNRQWEEALPGPQREKLNLTTKADERIRLVKEWRDQERDRQFEWRLAALQWDAIRENKKPWPFSDDALAKQVDAFVNSAFNHDTAVPRLKPVELAKLRSLQAATGQNAAWIPYGAYILQLADSYPTLPESPTGPPVTEVEQLSPKVLAELRNKGVVLKQRYRSVLGKWPEFALAIARDQKDLRPVLGDKPLGPCAPGDFAQPVNEFLANDLMPKLKPDEARRLKTQEGKWPEYPKLMIELAKAKDLSVPGVTLPGKPSLWAKYYRYTPTAEDRSGEN